MNTTEYRVLWRQEFRQSRRVLNLRTLRGGRRER